MLLLEVSAHVHEAFSYVIENADRGVFLCINRGVAIELASDTYRLQVAPVELERARRSYSNNVRLYHKRSSRMRHGSCVAHQRSLRDVTTMRWEPNSVCTGPVTSPSLTASLKTTASNSGTI